MSLFRDSNQGWKTGNKIACTLLKDLTDDAIAQLYVTKFLTISLYLTKLYVLQSLTIASAVKYSEIHQNFSNSVECSLMICLPVGSLEIFSSGKVMVAGRDMYISGTALSA